MVEPVPVLVLAGGRGARLAGVTDLPKPLVEVAGRPFVAYLLEALARQGFRRFFFLTGYRSAEFESALGPAVREALGDLELHFMPEELPLGTGGALRRAVPHVSERALVVNGDSYCGVDYHALLRLQSARGSALCLTAVQVPDAADYGGLALDRDGRVTGLCEKSLRGPGWVNAGVYAMPRAFLAQALPEGPASLEREILPAWIADHETWAYRAAGPLWDIGTPQRLARARGEFPPPDLSQA